MTLTKRIALVTGASRGIGKATAIALAEAGYDVAITARTVREGDGIDDSDAERRPVPGSLESTAATIEARGRTALTIKMDLLDKDSLTAAVATTVSEWGQIDLLVNNAVHTGPGSMSTLADTSVEMIETKLAANVVAPVILIQTVLPLMVERGTGTIINVTSAVAVTDPLAPAGQGGWGAAYAMSKGALHRLAGILAVEYPELRFFNVEPGYVVTERMEINAERLGLKGKFPGAPPSVPAAVIAWCATSSEADALNGQMVSAQRVAREKKLHEAWDRGT